MGADHQAGYLTEVELEQAELLARVNNLGLHKLRSYLESGQAVAFLGAGSSTPLYPLWPGVIAELIDAAAEQGMGEDAAATCRAMAGEQPDAVVELVRGHLGLPRYQAVLRAVFRVRHDPETGRTWTPTQELVCRCAFKAVVTTNYDPGIVNARMRVRPQASGTGFESWTDELALDRWRTEEVFGDEELPVLFAHGRHNQPEAIVLATTEYRRAYAGKLAQVLSRMVDAWHLVWIGFSFADQRINGVLREVAEHTGTRVNPGGVPRHVAVMAWDPATGHDPQTLRRLAEIQYGADLVLYPAPEGDHSALQRLLDDFVVDNYPPVLERPTGGTATQAPTAISPASVGSVAPGVETASPAISQLGLPMRWVPPVEVVASFTGRAEELARLDRWAADATVRLVGVTAWGGAGKTALVTHWLDRHGGAARRAGLRGVFGWSFYADPSPDHWANELLSWAANEFDMPLVGLGRPAAAVLELLQAVPLVLVLDGLEVSQEGPEGTQFGRLLDGALREVLTGACQLSHRGLVVLTSRFAFADLEGFDGGSVRILDVPPFTPTVGAALLAASGAHWMDEDDRRDMVQRVGGHALAIAVLGGLLAERPPAEDLEHLRMSLATAATTNSGVAKVLEFYAARLSEADRYLVAAVALFAHPVTPDAVLAVARHATFGGRLEGSTPQQVEAVARDRLTGLLSWHPDGTLSAHPLVRDTFRPLALGAAEVAAEVTLLDVPPGRITSREDGQRVVEAIELLLEVDQWQSAHDLWLSRTLNGQLWIRLPAARLGQRGAFAFIATPTRRQACLNHLAPDRLEFFLNEVGLHAMHGGDLTTAREYLDASVQNHWDREDLTNLSTKMGNLAECLGNLGEIGLAHRAAIAAVTHAVTAKDRTRLRLSEAYLARVLMLAGDIHAAEEHFIAADRILHADDPDGDHLYSLPGTWWGEFLANTSRSSPARALAERTRSIGAQHHWNPDVASSDRLLGRLSLAVGDTTTAEQRLKTAADRFRDGDWLVELADTLPILADCVRASGDLDAAARHAEEALTIAGPRNLRPSYATALTVHARIYADRAAASRDYLARGRDAADAAQRIATRHRLAWHELDSLEAQAHLDQVEGEDHGWSGRATALRARLIPAGLDPDPLATVERLVAEDPDGDGPPDQQLRQHGVDAIRDARTTGFGERSLD